METDRPARRVGPGEPLGVDEAMIERLVHAFYAKVRVDPALGPIFNGAIADWEPHLARMCEFWSSVILMTGRYKGNPMAAHIRVGGIRPTHFARWLHLFQTTAAEVCPPEAAALFDAKARQIAQSLELGIAASRGELPQMNPVSGRANAGTNA